ncbi:single-stranded-DNA-specific exonuclease RecJ [Desulfosporosinus orientis DSM 765]|uniref:Single-stranded-DNA-specific exonuclease RecJ n=1 Tax=Desulfosporosinus orientis (strain ATCC 19365 / DSM 765 / NCIMB 8382 / VKM B-1628 / Singapore I) TaxID=768706 RepID=G7W5H8_DESOD|nr:single-stranded-DNA-specific exonuclease RecJ [Desulfosporosinus orientis]AET66625.1 single-stranded-DNA-specific exonuclease RecJ [Desulfosporosinus orientis DSM 765]
MEKWFIRNTKNFLEKNSKSLGISNLLCKLLANRGITTFDSAMSFIKPEFDQLHDPRLMKDIEKGASIIIDKIEKGKKIRIIGDYDVDGVISTFLLYKALIRCNAVVDYDIPHRILDGYGINIDIIKKAKNEGVDTLITCDNGISAIEQIDYAKDLGLTVIITDHHEVAFSEDIEGNRIYKTPNADAVIDIKQMDCNYPCKTLCGAGVAFKLVQVIFEEMNIPKEEAFSFVEYVAIATVCDVVDLIEENRIFVKKGLEMINNTQNMGLKALIKQTGIEDKNINVYYLGFIIGPCINASGRLDSAKMGLRLLLTDNITEASEIALELHKLNTERKEMTIKGVDEIVQIIEGSNIRNDKVFIVYKPNIHESIAGIIAGKIRERYNVPTIVLTDSEQGVKGSGRSIEEYNMFEELSHCNELLKRFGGHEMAAGLSLEAMNVDALRERMNRLTTLTEEDLTRKIRVDGLISLDKINLALAEELTILEPYGKGNAKPLFAEKDISISRSSILGAKKNVLKLKLLTESNKQLDCVYFGDINSFEVYIIEKFGQSELDKMHNGLKNNVKLDMIFTIEVNEYNGNRTVQLILQSYR